MLVVFNRKEARWYTDWTVWGLRYVTLDMADHGNIWTVGEEKEVEVEATVPAAPQALPFTPVSGREVTLKLFSSARNTLQ